MRHHKLLLLIILTPCFLIGQGTGKALESAFDDVYNPIIIVSAAIHFILLIAYLIKRNKLLLPPLTITTLILILLGYWLSDGDEKSTAKGLSLLIYGILCILVILWRLFFTQKK